jgi:hypothetical protein
MKSLKTKQDFSVAKSTEAGVMNVDVPWRVFYENLAIFPRVAAIAGRHLGDIAGRVIVPDRIAPYVFHPGQQQPAIIEFHNRACPMPGTFRGRLYDRIYVNFAHNS